MSRTKTKRIKALKEFIELEKLNIEKAAVSVKFD